MAGEHDPPSHSVPQPERHLPAGVASRFEDGALRISLPLDVYGLPAILRSCYWLTDRCFVYLGRPKDGEDGVIEVTLLSKTVSSEDTDRLTWDFLNDLVDQRLRIEINAETRTIRDLIVTQAFAEVDVIDDRGRPRGQGTHPSDHPTDDPEGIKTWRPVS